MRPKKPFTARVRHRGKTLYFGSFATAAERNAVVAAKRAELGKAPYPKGPRVSGFVYHNGERHYVGRFSSEEERRREEASVLAMLEAETGIPAGRKVTISRGLARVLKSGDATPGARIIRLRLARGLSQAGLARRAGLGGSLLGKIESNKITPAAEKLGKVASALGVTMDYLWFGTKTEGGAVDDHTFDWFESEGNWYCFGPKNGKLFCAAVEVWSEEDEWWLVRVFSLGHTCLDAHAPSLAEAKAAAERAMTGG